MKNEEIIGISQKFVDYSVQSMRERNIPLENKKFIQDVFCHGADYARTMIGMEVKKWLTEHYLDEAYWSGDGEDLYIENLTDDLLNFIMGKE